MRRNDFQTAGQELFLSLNRENEPFSIGVLVVEACRIADRLDALNELIVGAENVWMRLQEGRDGVLEVRMDSALQESRQQATTLRQLLAEIHRQRDGDDANPDDDDDLADI